MTNEEIEEIYKYWKKYHLSHSSLIEIAHEKGRLQEAQEQKEIDAKIVEGGVNIVTEIIDFETFAARHGASKTEYCQPASHRLPGHSKAEKRRALLALEKRMREWEKRRVLAIEEYRGLVLSGAIRPPTRIERLEIVAAGDPEKESTQAAKRLLERYKNNNMPQRGDATNAK